MAIKPTKRELNAINTKQKLYDASMILFSKYDFDSVTVDDICQEAGISKGTFYNFINSKDDLVVVAFINMLDTYIEKHYNPEPTLNIQNKFVSFMSCMFDFADYVGKEFTRKSYVAQINTEIELRIKNRVMVSTLMDIIHEGEKLDIFKFKCSDIEYYTHIIGTFSGILIKWSTDHANDFDWKEMVKNQARVILK